MMCSVHVALGCTQLQRHLLFLDQLSPFNPLDDSFHVLLISSETSFGGLREAISVSSWQSTRALPMPPASVLDQTRETTKLLAKAQLRPYIPQLAPHLKKLAPHASRLNALFDIYAPHLAALVPELPRLLPHLGVLLDELTHLEPQLEVFVRHRNFLLPHLDVIAPHLYSLRAHRDVLAASLPRLAPHLCVLVPHTAALLPHLGPLLEAVKRGDLPVDEMAQAARLRLLLPHVAAFAPQLPAIAPYWKELLPNLDALEQMHALKPLAARLPELAPQLGRILKHRERLGARLPGLLADPGALAIELRACDAAVVGSAATAAGAGAAEGGLFSGVVRFLGGISSEETKAKAEVAAVEAAAAKADKASFIAKTRGERRVAVRRVNEALSIAARRMVDVEQKFVTEKNASANRRTHLNEEVSSGDL